MAGELMVAGEPIADGRPHTHFEIKAHLGNLVAARARALELGAIAGGELYQEDYYFRVPHGRLKLREIPGVEAQLMYYDRKEDGPRRWSDFRRVAVTDPAGMRAALTEALGLRGVVMKRRRVFLWQKYRIHLDEVEGLGTFIELELESHGDSHDDRDRMQRAMAAFGIDDADCVRASYADLLGL